MVHIEAGPRLRRTPFDDANNTSFSTSWGKFLEEIATAEMASHKNIYLGRLISLVKVSQVNVIFRQSVKISL